MVSYLGATLEEGSKGNALNACMVLVVSDEQEIRTGAADFALDGGVCIRSWFV